MNRLETFYNHLIDYSTKFMPILLLFLAPLTARFLCGDAEKETLKE
ncbi:MAG: hypothetical protein ACYS6W_01455 [Planctomycetota bacterium]|jgi:hypothetical protein